VHAPYPNLGANLQPGGILYEFARTGNRRIVFYCAYGERSAMAVKMAQDAGILSACHIEGGLDAWKKADGPVERSKHN
jgi:rhodanese-related sulfurtransferase